MELQGGLEPLTDGTILHQFQAPEETPSPDVAHVGMIPQFVAQTGRQVSPPVTHLGQEVVTLDDPGA